MNACDNGQVRKQVRCCYRRGDYFTDARLLRDGPDLVDVAQRVLELLPRRLEHGGLGRRDELELRRRHLAGPKEKKNHAVGGEVMSEAGRQRDNERPTGVHLPAPSVYYCLTA